MSIIRLDSTWLRACYFKVLGQPFVKPEWYGLQTSMQQTVSVFVPQVFLDAIAPIGVDGQFLGRRNEIGSAGRQSGVSRLNVLVIGQFVAEQIHDDVFSLQRQLQTFRDLRSQ